MIQSRFTSFPTHGEAVAPVCIAIPAAVCDIMEMSGISFLSVRRDASSCASNLDCHCKEMYLLSVHSKQ